MHQDPPPVEQLRAAYARWHETRGVSSELFVDLLDEDVVMRTCLEPPGIHPIAQDRVGKEYARQYLDSLALNLEMVEFPTDRLVTQGDTVVWIGSCRWRDRKTGVEVSTQKVDVWRFRDGKAIDVLEMFDSLGFATLNRLVEPVTA